MGRADALRAELTVIERDEELVKAKNTKAGASAELKAEVRAARKAFREQREAEAASDGAARPGPVSASARAKNVGGN